MNDATTPMTKPSASNRIRELRKAKGPAWTLEYLAERAGTTAKQISRLERGERRLTESWMRRLGDALEVRPYELMSEFRVEPYRVQVVGYLGAGSQYYPDPDAGPWQPFDSVETGPDNAAVVALRVRGPTMEPTYRDGEVVYFETTDVVDLPVVLSKDCIAQEKNGPAVLCRIEWTDTPGHLRLTFYDGTPAREAELLWASPISWVRRR